MEQPSTKFKWGPLFYITDIFSDNNVGNYYHPGLPPVSYSTRGVPIDENGIECLDLSCPLHPDWAPNKFQVEYNDYLQVSAPKWEVYSEWLNNKLIVCTEGQAKKWMIWWTLLPTPYSYRRLFRQTIVNKMTLNNLTPKELLKEMYNESQNTNN